MGNLAIHVESLGKRYRIGERNGYRTLRDSLARVAMAPLRWFGSGESNGVQGRRREIRALRDVSFDISEGEVVGLIGRNGAGKTTLLKILSRITRPTEGFADIRGRVGSLLEVGTGFHPELTGRENAYLNGAILGMSKREIDQRFEEIVAFAGVADFIDAQLKHYSTGMQMRLAFSVAAHLEPEILLVDEVLAVGDIAFQRKCLARMGEAAETGRTIVFVTHQMNQIRRLCERVLWIDEGTIRHIGPTAEVVGAYESAMASGAKGSQGNQTGGARFLRWEIEDGRGETPHILSQLGPVTVRFVVQVNKPIRRGHHGVALFNMERQLMWAWAKDGIAMEPGVHSLIYTFPMLPLRPGIYGWQVSVWEDGDLVEIWDSVPEMNIATPVFQHARDEWNGVLNVACELSIQEDR